MAAMRGLNAPLGLITLLFFLCSCTSMHQRTLEPGEPVPPTNAIFVVHQGPDVLGYLRGVAISDRVLRGMFQMKVVKSRDVTIDPLPDQINRRPGRKQQGVHLFVSESYDLAGATTVSKRMIIELAIPLDDIDRVEVYEKRLNGKHTTILLIALGTLAVFVALAASFAASEPMSGGFGSCPQIYAFDGDEPRFIGEIYGGATLPSLERDDYLHLPRLQPADGEYRLEIANEMNEIDHTNLTELLIVDHAPGERALFDKYGAAHLVDDLQGPESARTVGGEDVLREIRETDGMAYAGTPRGSAVRGMDGLELTFDRPAGASDARLVVNGKNSFWLEHVHEQFRNHFGDTYTAWNNATRAMPAKGIRQWGLEQGIPLSVYIEKHGRWEFAETFDPVGPLGSRDQVLNLDLSDLEGDELNIKLQFGFLFWEIDSVEIDFNATSPAEWSRAPIVGGLDEQGGEVSRLLAADDDAYYVQPQPGNRATLTFDAPPLAPGLARSVTLHSKGYYEIPTHPQGPVDRAFLTEFLEPGRLGEYSREKYVALLRGLEE